jgi:exopolysaccharide biosynthesis operon protein EpsL
MKRAGARASMILAAAVLGAVPALGAEAPEETVGTELTIGAREVYDDNLYRLPAIVDPSSNPAGDVARDDYVQRVSLGLEQAWQWSRQKVLIDLLAVDSRYQRNEQLDHTSGRGRAEWEWRAGKSWSGAIGGDYNRALANFANTRYLGKDVLETTGTFANLGFRLGPSWSLRAAARRASTEHSAELRRFDNSTTESFTGGLRYKTSSETEIGLSVRSTRARFESALNLSGQLFGRDYEDESVSLELERVVSPRTRFTGSIGHLQRGYDDASLADAGKGSFDGPVGDVLVEWQASNKIAIEVNGWRRLRAYLDAESDYFVSEGLSIGPTWTPTHKIELALGLGIETQDYLGAGLSLPVERRDDEVSSGELTLTYRPLRKLRFDLTGRVERRDSNRPLVEYDSLVASLGVRWSY